jgi:predicted PurR-regulated permease PerM
MNIRRQVTFWVATLLVLVVVLWLLGDVLLPFVAGIALAYFLDPIADRLERLGLPRWAAATIILLAFLLALVIGVILLVPLLGEQFEALRERLPAFIASVRRIVAEVGQGWFGRLVGGRFPDIERTLSSSAGQGASYVATVLASIWTGGQALLGLVSLLVITPVVAFYMLLDWDRMVGKVDSWLPREHADTVRLLARDIDSAIAGFVRGQATVCLLLGLFYGFALTIAGLNFGFLIGLTAGLVSFIPFVGSIFGFIVSVGVGLVQTWPEWQLPVIVAIIFVVGQFIEGNILSPRLVGSSVGLHPVWLMFALLVAGSLFGFLGLLVAVPVAAAIGVLMRFALGRYLASPLYTGTMRHPAALVEHHQDRRLEG